MSPTAEGKESWGRNHGGLRASHQHRSTPFLLIVHRAHGQADVSVEHIYNQSLRWKFKTTFSTAGTRCSQLNMNNIQIRPCCKHVWNKTWMNHASISAVNDQPSFWLTWVTVAFRPESTLVPLYAPSSSAKRLRCAISEFLPLPENIYQKQPTVLLRYCHSTSGVHLPLRRPVNQPDLGTTSISPVVFGQWLLILGGKSACVQQ